MESKICARCTLTKFCDEFYKRKIGKRAGKYYEICKSCMKIRGREYYHNNHDRQLSLALARRHRAYIERRSYINELKDRPCADCGIKYPYFVMDFDHRKGSGKITDVALMVRRGWSLDKIKLEILKCEIVCANCHRIRTFKNLLEPR